MTAAYQYAEGGGLKPHPLKLYDSIQTYGAAAVIGGRQLSVNEIYCMNASHNVFTAYRQRKASPDWTKWTQDNPALAEMLLFVERLE